MLFRDVLPALQFTLPETGTLDLATLLPGATRYVLEIGYGGGEHLARQALANPTTGYVGAEVFSGGIAKLVQQIDAEGIANVRLFTDDALKLLVTLEAGVLDEVYLLYPDPWPKTRHHKRRFVSPTTLGDLARVLKPGGIFRFATDIDDYADWTLAHIVREPKFRFEAAEPGSWHLPYPGWQPTRYDQKARTEGRATSFYFTFVRV